MDITKIFAVLCGFLLIVCLTLSITCLVVMRNAIEETTSWQARAEELVGVLDGCVQAMQDVEAEDIPVIAPDGNENTEDITCYCLRIENDSIGIYDADGYLIKKSDARIALLPQKEREKLTSGIWVSSWAEAGRLLQDYE